MNRRGLLKRLGLAPAAVLAGPEPRIRTAVWEAEPCPRCGKTVYFLPGQKKNRCAPCGRAVRRGVE